MADKKTRHKDGFLQPCMDSNRRIIPLKLYLKMLALFCVGFVVVGCAHNYVEQPMQTTLIGERAVVCKVSNEKARELYNIAHKEMLADNPERSKIYYRKAIKADPDYCDAMVNLARIYRSEGKYDEAILLYKKSLEIYPNNSVALINLAVAYKGTGEISKAIEQYRLLQKLDAGDPEGFYGLALVYFNQKKYKDSIENMLVAENIYEKSDSPYLHQAQKILGMSNYKVGNCQQSTLYLLNSYEHYPKDLYVNYYLGLCHLTKKLYDRTKAIEYLNIAEEAGVVVPAKIKVVLNSSRTTYLNFSNGL